MFIFSIESLSHLLYFFALFVIDIFFSNHIIKLIELIKLNQFNGQNLIFF